MFTDGLDPSALQWVREGSEVKPKTTSTVPEILSPSVIRDAIYPGRSASKGWSLPPTQLHNAHIHSSLLRPPLTASGDDLDESVGSVSGEAYNHEYEDFSDSEELESGRYSADSSPPDKSHVPGLQRGFEHENNLKSASYIKNGAHLESYVTDEYYYEYDKRLRSSMPNSKSNSRSNSRRESFGGLEGRQAQAWQKVKSSQETGYPPDESQRGGLEFSHGTGDYSDADLSGDGSLDERYGSMRADEGRNHIATQLAGSRYGYGRQTAYEQSSSSVQSDEMLPRNAYKDPCLVESRPRSLQENVRIPPSAPPMTGSAVSDTSAGIEGSIPDLSASQSMSKAFSVESQQHKDHFRPAKTNTAFSVEVEQRHSESVLHSGQTARMASAFGGEEDTLNHQAEAPMSQPPAVHLSGHAAWQAVIAYDACVRLCLRAWARGCIEAPEFLRDECSVLRNSFGLQTVLLQPQESIAKRAAVEDAETTAASKPRRDVGKIRVQVRKVRVLPRQVLRGGSSQRGAAYMQAGAQYMRQVSGLLKAGVNTLRNTAMAEVPQETFACILRLKSTPDEETVRMQPGSGETHVFHPESPGDDLMLEVQDSNGNLHGQVLVQLFSINDDPNDRIRWWPIYSEPEHECVGKVQLFINYTTNTSDANSNKWGPVGETLAYDIVLEVAMRVEHFQQRNLRLYGPWRWLLSEFALYYGVSDVYTKLRYMACIMEVATPTEDCLVLIYELLCPIVKARDENSMNRQERRILSDVEDQVEQLIALVFENYKSLDESLPSGLIETFTPAIGKAAPALVPAVQIFTLLHDILSSEAQMTLRNYFQTAAKKRCRRHMAESDEFVSSSNEGFLMDPITISTAYLKMKNLCTHIRNEVRTDIEIHNQHILPSSIDLPNIASSIYSVELTNRLRAFLVACPPSSPSPPVAELLLATADFQRDLASWNISPLKGGVDAKDLFHLYIVLWIQDKRLHLLDYCKLDKVRWTGVTTQHGTSPFVEEMYERVKDTLNEYEVVVNRWPEYTFALETAIADVETAVAAALEKQYADVLTPLKDVMIPKKFSLQYMQKLTRRRSLSLYSVPNQLGVFLNTIKRLLDTLRPKIELQMKTWVSCLPVEGGGGKIGFGERLNEVTVNLRAKYKNFLQAIVEKLADNARMQRTTKLKKILQDMREAGGESEIRDRMQLLNTQLTDTISHLHDVFTTRVFVAICRGYWDRMGREVLHFLENRKENRSWYKGSCFALAILDDTFASQMQKLQGHALQEKDLEPPRSIMEARSMLSKDAPNGVDSSNYYYF